jgi:uncharacterized protein (TIGR03089 family)
MLTYIDDAMGERIDLSAADLGSWAARTASMLRDGLGLAAGDRAAVLLPPHWQTAAVLLGSWSIGVTVSFRPWATSGLTPPAEEEQPVEALFVTRARQDSWLETMPEAWHRFVLSLAPDAAASGDVPAGYRDFIGEVRKYPAETPAYESVALSGPASPDGTTYQQLGALAGGVADMIGLKSGDRLLVDAAGSEQPVKWLLAPLTVGASIVIVANANPGSHDEYARAESVTHVLS